jgi:multidrug efflux system membrane fusion protein
MSFTDKKNMYKDNAMKHSVMLVCLLLLSLGCSKPSDPPQAKVSEVPVTTAAVVAKDVPLAVDAPGVVVPLRTVTMLSQVTGQLKEIPFREGQDVEKGDILFVLDTTPFEERVKEAKSCLLKDEATLAFQKSEARRYANIGKGGAASKSDIERTRTEALATEAQIQADAAALKQARLNLSYCTIRAPFTGRTGRYLAHEGAIVKANTTALVTVHQISPIYVGFSVPERHLPAIQKLMRENPLKVTAYPSTDPNVLCDGRLVFLDNSVDQGTGMVFLKAEFENRDQALWPGQYVVATLILRVEKGVLTAPRSAVMPGQKGPYVFVVKPDMTVESRLVTVDRNVGDEAVISKGLALGETVVLIGQNKLQSGFRVKVVKAQAAPGG